MAPNSVPFGILIGRLRSALLVMRGQCRLGDRARRPALQVFAALFQDRMSSSCELFRLRSRNKSRLWKSIQGWPCWYEA